MKVVFITIFLALVVYVSSEMCRDSRACHDHGITKCGSNYDVVCNREHQCECLQSGGSSSGCTMQSDCPDCDGGRDKHCVDGNCRCSRN